MEHIIEHAIAAAHLAGAYLRAHAFDDDAPQWKKKDDPVTAHDREAEHLIKEYLDVHAPGNYLGEEHGSSDNGRAVTYIIDPIDGTKEWVSRGFRCSTSIGIAENGELTGGVVYDFMRDITYAGHRGQLLILHDGKVTPWSAPPSLGKIRIAVDRHDALEKRLPRDRFSVCDAKGSIALAMAHVAAGIYDGMVSVDIGKGNLWDVAAGTYLCRAAHVRLSDAYGRPFDEHRARDGIVALRTEHSAAVLAYRPFIERTSARTSP